MCVCLYIYSYRVSKRILETKDAHASTVFEYITSLVLIVSIYIPYTCM